MSLENLTIIGSGPAAYTAAIYAARAQLNPVIIAGPQPGGQLMGTSYVENWPGINQVLGPKLMLDMREHAAHFGTRFVDATVTQVDFTQQPFSITTDYAGTIQTKTVIIATGATPRRMGCPGEDEYWGRGVTTCAVCDGAFYKDKKVIIVGGGDTAMEDASFMTHFTNQITVVHIRETLTASKAMQERIIDNPAIKIIYNSTISLVEGNGQHLTHATITHQKTGASERAAVDGMFVAVGLRPNTTPFGDQLALTSSGHILLKEHTQTSIPGIFAAGDVADARYRQAITSAGSGCMAALDAERYLKTL